MGDDHTEVNRDVRGSDRVTITEAATLLGVHPNTVRGRVKAGVYEAEKVATEHGLMWMIARNSLVNHPLPRESQSPPSQLVNHQAATPITMIQDLLRPFVEDLGKVREELGTERVLRVQAEQERDELRRQLEALQEPREAPVTASEGTDSGEAPSEQQEPAQQRSWLYRFFFGP